MYDDLEHEAERLLDSETRYKNVVNNIREVLVQINLHHQWHFLSPAWLVLTGYEVDKSLNQSINSFFHHHDQAKLIQQVENLFAGKAADWTGEIRLVNTKQHVLWVRLSLQVISDKDANFIVGTIENIHIHHLTNESNEVLRMTEQMVVSSDSAIFPLLDYVTTKMAKALDVSLLWIYISDPSDKSELFKAGDLVDFLYEKTKIWDGLLASDSPVTDSLQSHDSIRLSEHSTTVDHWRARLEAHQIKDSIIIPLQLRHDYVGIIGVHSDLEDVFNAPFQQLLNNFSAGLRVVCHLSVEQQLMRLHRAAVETSANAIMITDSNRVIEWVNHAFEVLTEYHLNDIAGKTPHILTTADDANEISTEIWNSISQANVWQGELTIQCKSGSVITVHETITPLLNHQGKITHYISIIQNITEAKANQERIEFLATHDKLTSLPNRSLLNDRMETAIAHSKRHNSMFAVLFIDLDQFKVINDSFGHQFGDQLIQKVADRISAELRMDDTVARFGGDEFVIILSEVHDEKDISHVAEKLLFVIKQGYYIKGHEINISASIGISVFPNDADSAEVLLQSADSAMYQSKELGRNAYRFYTKELHEKVLRKHQIEEALRKAVAEEQFVLYYQPKIDLKTKRIMGAECLIRWQHPEMGIVSPLEFIPLAEETGMILNIGTWVLEQSCQQMHRWSTQYDWFKSLSINLSARQFQQEDFITDIKSIFTQTKVDPQKIDLEITESLLMDNIEDAIRTLACLQAIGASISIDDFGTGYSSLSYLKRLPANTLKIDRSFVKELGHGDENEAIIRSILALADNLQLDVVAEGIEEEAQDAILTEMGCQYAQGYLFSKPLSLEEFNQLLEETNSKSPS
jgi:diguanylate cyclase (GGDEF)-like protein/PAS domain S-box-containing protein